MREHSVRWRNTTMTSRGKTLSLSRPTERNGLKSRRTQRLTLCKFESSEKRSKVWHPNFKKPRRNRIALKGKSAPWTRTQWPCATPRATTKTSKRRSGLWKRNAKNLTASIKRLSRKSRRCTTSLNKPQPSWETRRTSRTKSWSRSWWCSKASTRRRNLPFASFCSAATWTKTNSTRSAKRWRKLSSQKIASLGI